MRSRHTTDPFFFFVGVAFQGCTCGILEIPRLGVKSELQLLVYTPATATRDLSLVCNLHHSSWQHWILNPLSETRDGTCILVDTSWVHYG